MKKKVYLLSVIMFLSSIALFLSINCGPPPSGGVPKVPTPPPSYLLTYHANGGDTQFVPFARKYAAGGQVITAQPGLMTLAGHKFTRWNTRADGTGTSYAPDEIFIMPAKELTLYAGWTQKPTYYITYDRNGAAGGDAPNDNNSYYYGDDVTVAGAGTLIKQGCVLSGWDTSPDGSGTFYEPGSFLTIYDKNVTLYAQWEIAYGTIDSLALIPKQDMVWLSTGSFVQKEVSTDQISPGDSFTHHFMEFEIGKYEVTYELWYSVLKWAQNNGYTITYTGQEGSNGIYGAKPTDARHEPVVNIRWCDAIIWCNAYSEMSNLQPVYRNAAGEILKNSSPSKCKTAVVRWYSTGYRLPTEGEWQYAASYQDRTNWTPYDTISGDSGSYSESMTLDNYSWNRNNSQRKTQITGTKSPNQMGIHDMSGNATELCWDWHGPFPETTQYDYRGPAQAGTFESKIIKGGCYNDIEALQVGYRTGVIISTNLITIGLRVARTGPGS